jgi:predicted RND superfamily exporter protein
MGWAGIPVTLVTTILPIVVLTMSITDEIHLLDRLREHLTPGTPRTSAMSAAISDVGRPIVLTSWTTAAGLLSFTFTSIAPLRHFGLFAAFGVLVAMLLSFTLIPALVVRLPEHWFAAPARGEPAPGAGASGSRFLGAPSALVGAALVVLAVPFIPRLEARDSWVDNLGPNSPLVRATQRFDRAFWGSYRYDVVLHAEELAYFQFPPGLAAVEKMVAHLETAPHVAGVVSHLDAHEIHADVDSLPLPVSALPLETVRRFSGELMKIQGRIDLEHFLSADGRSARIRLLVPDADYATTEALERFIDETVPRMLEGTELTFHTSGPLAAAQASVGAVVGNVMRSTALTFVAIALLLTLALRSAAQALVCLLPLVGAVTILLGGMAWWGIPLGIATGMLTALTAGAGVDFGLHALHAYRASRGSGMPHAQALTATLVRAGRPIAWNATVLASGLLALGVSSVPPNQRLGVLLASAMVLCCVMSALVLPWSLGKLPAPRAEGP